MKNPIKGLFRPRSRDKPTNAIGSAFSFLFGGSNSGKNVNERTAIQRKKSKWKPSLQGSKPYWIVIMFAKR